MAPKKAPEIAGNIGNCVRATANPTRRKDKLPSKVFSFWNGSLCQPNRFPIRVEAESPKSRMSIAALTTFMLNLKR